MSRRQQGGVDINRAFRKSRLVTGQKPHANPRRLAREQTGQSARLPSNHQPCRGSWFRSNRDRAADFVGFETEGGGAADSRKGDDVVELVDDSLQPQPVDQIA